jgi:hypothetical protein
MKDQSLEIQDLINTAPVESTTRAIDRLLNICEALNKRMDAIETKTNQIQNETKPTNI